MKKIFSSGSPELDTVISGLVPGDSLLYLIPDPVIGRILRRKALEAAISARNHVACCSLSSEGLPDSSRRFKIHTLGQTRRSWNTEYRTIRRFISQQPTGALLILEDLSEIARVFSERAALELFSWLAEILIRRKSVLVSSLERASMEVPTIIRLKDLATISLDIAAHRDEYYVLPLTMRGRYVPNNLNPLRFSLSRTEGQPASETIRFARYRASAPGMAEIAREVFFTDERYTRMFADAPEGLFLFELAGSFREFNGKLLSVLGYSADELQLANPLSLVDPRDRRRTLQALTELRRRRQQQLEVSIRTKAGRMIPAVVGLYPLGGGLFLGTIRDNAERLKLQKRLAELEEENSSLVMKSPYPVLLVQDDVSILANGAFLKAFNYPSADQVTGKRLKGFFTPESWRSLQKLRRERASGESAVGECVALRSDGTPFSVRMSVSELRVSGRVSELVAFTDISREKEIARELALAHQKYAALLEGSTEGVTVFLNGRCIAANRAYREMFGIESDEELIGREVFIAPAEPEAPLAHEIIQKIAKRTLRATTISYESRRKDGEPLELKASLLPETLDHDNLVFVFHTDATEEKHLEREADRQRKEMEQLEEISGAISPSAGLEAVLRASLHQLSRITAMESGILYLLEAGEKGLVAREHRNAPELLLENLGKLDLDGGIGGLLSKTHNAYRYSLTRYPSYLPHRKLLTDAGSSALCLIPLVAENRLNGLVLLSSKKDHAGLFPSDGFLAAAGRRIGQLISDAEAHRKVSDLLSIYRGLVESISEVTYRMKDDGTFLFLSEGIEELIGHVAREFMRTPSRWLALVHPEDKKLLLERTANLERAGERVVLEYRVLPRGKATYRWVRDIMLISKRATGEIQDLSGIIDDITHEKETLDALREQTISDNNVFGSIREALCIFDNALRCIRWNEAMEAMTGLPSPGVLGRTAGEIFGDGPNRPWVSYLKKALAGEAVTSDDLQYVGPSKEKELSIGGSFSPIVNSSGLTTGVVGLCTEIGGRKKIERELRESEHIFRNVIDTMDDLLMVTDLTGKVFQVNQTFLTKLGFNRNDVVGCEFPYPWLVEEEMSRYVLWISNLRDRAWLHDFDMTWKMKSGKFFSISLSTTLLRNSLGEPVAMLNLARDITERRRLMRELENRNRQVELINRVISAANQSMDLRELSTLLASEIKSVVGADGIHIELLGDDGRTLEVYRVTAREFLYKEAPQLIAGSVSGQSVKTAGPILIADLAQSETARDIPSLHPQYRSLLSLPFQLKGRTVGTLNMYSKEVQRFSDEDIETLQPLAQQMGTVIDRLRLFRQVKDDASYVRNLLDSIDNIVCTVDRSYRILEVNKAWYEFIRECGGDARIDFQGRNLYEVLPDESLRSRLRTVLDEILAGKVRFYSDEWAWSSGPRRRLFQITVNPMTINQKITGLVITQADISSLKMTELELKRNNEQLIALNQVSTLIKTSLNLKEILDVAVPRISSAVGSDAILVYLNEKGTNDLLLVQSVGFSAVSAEELLRLPRTGTLMGAVVRTRDPLFITGKVYDDARIIPERRNVFRAENAEALALIPLLTQDTVLGALAIFYRKPFEFPPQSRQILALIGNQLGTAIENAQLYSETVAKSLEIERRNKELDDFTYVVSHDLKEPLISIEGFSKILQMDYSDIIQGEGREYLGSIVGATTRMKLLIDDLLMLSRVGRTTESFSDIPIGRIIKDITTDLRFVIERKGAEIIVPEQLPTVFGNETHLKVVFLNLISNALKFNRSPHPTVEIGFRFAENNSYLFSVKDNGIGIDREFHEKVFIIFQRLHRREDYDGTGAGLAIVKKIIEQHKGKIWVESEPGKGSTFYFTIPTTATVT